MIFASGPDVSDCAILSGFKGSPGRVMAFMGVLLQDGIISLELVGHSGPLLAPSTRSGSSGWSWVASLECCHLCQVNVVGENIQTCREF